MAKKTRMFYVTKYWETKGIFCVEGEVEGMTLWYRTKLGYTNYISRHNWHKTKDEAIKRVQECLSQTIASLEKKLAKLKKLDVVSLVKGEEDDG